MPSVLGEGMSLSRRDFFKKLATAGVVIAVAHKVLVEAVLPATPVAPNNPLTFAMLENAYQQCVFGREEPDLIAMAPDLFAQFCKLFPNVFLVESEGDTSYVCRRFEGAAVTYDKNLPAGTWLQANSLRKADTYHVENPHLDGYFYGDYLLPGTATVKLGPNPNYFGIFNVNEIDEYGIPIRKSLPQEYFAKAA